MNNHETLVHSSVYFQDDPKKWAEELARVGKEEGYDYPLAHLCFKIAPQDTAAHSPAFMAAANSEAGYAAMIRASKILAVTMLELFHDPNRVAAIKEEFRQEKQKEQNRVA